MRGEMLSTLSRPKGNNSEQLLLCRPSKPSKLSRQLQARTIGACQLQDKAESTLPVTPLSRQTFPVHPSVPPTRAGGLPRVPLLPPSSTRKERGAEQPHSRLPTPSRCHCHLLPAAWGWLAHPNSSVPSDGSREVRGGSREEEGRSTNAAVPSCRMCAPKEADWHLF